MKKKWQSALGKFLFVWFGMFGMAWVNHSYAQAPDMQPVNIGNPRIDLQAVEQALHNTRSTSPQDFRGWMMRFEDEVNAIYFATLRRQFPQADPATLMPQPVRVDAQWNNQLLYLYGYIDQNNVAGFQHGQDLLLFVFEQTRPYTQNNRIYYALRDGDGYYYRDTDYYYAWNTMTPYFAGFFLYPRIWIGSYWRPAFTWWGTPYWRSGFFYSRYNHYYGLYPRYYNRYRTTYYTRYRPWGWRRGTFFNARGGRYYYRSRQWATRNRQWRQQYRGYIRQRQQFRRNQQRWNQQRRQWHRQYRKPQQYRRYRRQRQPQRRIQRPQRRIQRPQRPQRGSRGGRRGRK